LLFILRGLAYGRTHPELEHPLEVLMASRRKVPEGTGGILPGLIWVCLCMP